MTITGDVLFFGLMILALILMFNAHKGHLFAFGAFFTWFALGFWMFFSDSPPLDINEIWVQILVYVFFALLPFGTLLRMMNIEIIHEIKGKKYREYGPPPKQETRAHDRYWEYKKNLRSRLR